MTQLARELSYYYVRKNNRILFKNTFTLNRLAIEMYEKLGYTQIDSSVISRVLKGERLFTPQQLETFCHILQIPEEGQINLFRALQEDHLQKKGYQKKGLIHFSNHDKIDVIDDLIREAFLVYYDGRCLPLKRLINITDTYIRQLSEKSLSEPQLQKLQELQGLHLYLSGRFIGCMGLTDSIIPEMRTVSNALFSLSDTAKISKLTAYANILLSDAYYIAGGYSTDENKKKFYQESIVYGKKSLPLLDDKDHNKVLALRNMAASAVYLGDERTFLSLKKTAEEIIERQPLENRVYTLQFCATIATGDASFGIASPFKMKQKAITHFGASLKGHGAFEISDIRAELETLSIMGAKDKGYMQSLITKGSILAEQENMVRYENYFSKLESSL